MVSADPVPRYWMLRQAILNTFIGMCRRFGLIDDQVKFIQFDDAIKATSDFHGVSDHQQRHGFFSAAFDDQVDDLLLIARVDVSSWFVGQQQSRAVGERSERWRLAVARRQTS